MSIDGKKLLKGAALLSLGQAAGYGLSFARNLILARVLTKADFGLAAALAMAISLLELVNQMAFGRQIVQAPEGDQPGYQAAAQGVQAVVGLVSALLVVAMAWPMALAFRHPELTWAFACMALVPLARGVLHLDLARVQRHLIYGPQVIVDFVPQVLATAAAWPLAVWLHDFRAVLWIMLGKEALGVVLSHLLAERPYRWAWDRELALSMWAFGWPLLLNGLVMFGAQQGDQMLIGATFSLEQLAVYSIAFTLASVPWFLFGQVASLLMLPLLARHQANAAQFELHYRRCLELSALAGMLMMGPLIVAGDALVRFLYGAKYAGAGPLMAVFGTIGALRFFRWAPALAAMSRADTVNQLYGNLARALSLPIALVLVGLGTRSVLAVAACGIAGEALALMATLYRVRVRLNIGWTPHAGALAFLAGWLAAAACLSLWLGAGGSLLGQAAGILLLCATGSGVAAFLFPELSELAGSACRDWLPTSPVFSFLARATTRPSPKGKQPIN